MISLQGTFLGNGAHLWNTLAFVELVVASLRQHVATQVLGLGAAQSSHHSQHGDDILEASASPQMLLQQRHPHALASQFPQLTRSFRTLHLWLAA